jgi:hypothetical protein
MSGHTYVDMVGLIVYTDLMEIVEYGTQILVSTLPALRPLLGVLRDKARLTYSRATSHVNNDYSNREILRSTKRFSQSEGAKTSVDGSNVNDDKVRISSIDSGMHSSRALAWENVKLPTRL